MAAPPYQANPQIGLEPTQDYGSNPPDTGPPATGQAATLVEGPQGLVGQCIGQYRVLRELGRGGMGVVYKAVHVEIGQHAALKTLHPEISGNPQFRRRFLNEARASTIAQHPGMVKVFDSGQLTDGTLYLLMEFLEGETVAARLSAGGKQRQALVESVTLRLGRQIASALAVAHARGIAHRGRTPSAACVGAARRGFSRLSRPAGNQLLQTRSPRPQPEPIGRPPISAPKPRHLCEDGSS